MVFSSALRFPLISPLNLFRRRLQRTKQDKHWRLWQNIFQSREWADEALSAKLNPVLLGPNLDAYYSYRSTSKAIYVYLDMGDAIGDFTRKELGFIPGLP